MRVANISMIPQDVRIIVNPGQENQRKTVVMVMPKARPTLPPNSIVDPNWLAVNPRSIVVFEDQKAPTIENDQLDD